MKVMLYLPIQYQIIKQDNQYQNVKQDKETFLFEKI